MHSPNSVVLPAKAMAAENNTYCKELSTVCLKVKSGLLNLKCPSIYLIHKPKLRSFISSTYDRVDISIHIHIIIHYWVHSNTKARCGLHFAYTHCFIRMLEQVARSLFRELKFHVMSKTLWSQRVTIITICQSGSTSYLESYLKMSRLKTAFQGWTLMEELQ